MQAYKAHPAITKAAFVAEMKAHAEADHFTPSRFWDPTTHTGCAVGCGIQSIRTLTSPREIISHRDDSALAKALGIPISLIWIEEAVFERLPEPEQTTWPVRFAEAIPEGADLSNVYKQWMVWVLRTICPSEVSERTAKGIETNWAPDCPKNIFTEGQYDSYTSKYRAAYFTVCDTIDACAIASIHNSPSDTYILMSDKLLEIIAATP